MSIFLVHLFFLVLVLVLFAEGGGVGGGGAGDDECKVTRCGDHGPDIRFPFRLKDLHPHHCGYHPDFDLSCTHTNDTVFELQFPVKASVKEIDPPFSVKEIEFSYSVKASVYLIDYKGQEISLSYLDGIGCLPLPRHLLSLNLNSSASPFKLLFYDSLTLFNCSSASPIDYSPASPISCLGGPGYQIYAVSSFDSISDMSLISCRKMYNISFVPFLPSYYHFYLNWSEPNCLNCEAKGKYCRLKKKSIYHETECYQPTSTEGASKKLVLSGEILGPIFVALVAIALYRVIISYKRNKDDQVKIEKFLEDYKALKPTRYSYADIKKLTNQFKDKLGQGGYGTVYKGKLSDDVLVAVKVLNSDFKGNGEDQFINEVGTIGKIHHVNVVRLIGYCADGYKRALVYEFLPNNSLEKFGCSWGKNHEKENHFFLGWEKLQDIALGIAKGIEYLHQGCAQRILHFDIKPHNILLDHNFNPKISDFGLAKLCSKEQSIVSMTAARGTIGYIAPEVFSRNFGNVSSKSDVYSFGMLLLEMVGARKNINDDVPGELQNSSQAYFPQYIYDRLDQGGELGIQIDEEEGTNHTNIAKKLAIVGLWCIRWYPIDRPSMKVVIQMLEGEDCPTMPPNPFASTNPRNTSGTSITTRAKTFNYKLEVISELE